MERRVNQRDPRRFLIDGHKSQTRPQKGLYWRDVFGVEICGSNFYFDGITQFTGRQRPLCQRHPQQHFQAKSRLSPRWRRILSSVAAYTSCRPYASWCSFCLLR
ncbi:hypothetical protein L873DRAFT_271530 [Choiromyces venosus 120613-1]|uniref:Uncharacterized protein n=1 Tax=Choiromyces venosus 120613-1 TaxID=1336337 RepID=A0A3N4J002_9PEZI|nr:hypothetical protein L873DRAFT_271530 [Choiromyces venosus 120613-1]